MSAPWAFAAFYAGLLVCNAVCWAVSQTKSAATMNAFAAGINSMALLHILLRATP